MRRNAMRLELKNLNYGPACERMDDRSRRRLEDDCRLAYPAPGQPLYLLPQLVA